MICWYKFTQALKSLVTLQEIISKYRCCWFYSFFEHLFWSNNLCLLFREKSRKECMPESLNRCSSSFIKRIIFVLKYCILITYSFFPSSKWFKMYCILVKKNASNSSSIQEKKKSTLCFIYHKKIVEIFSNYFFSNWSLFLQFDVKGGKIHPVPTRWHGLLV